MKKSVLAIGVIAAAVAVGYPTYKTMFGAQAVSVDSAELTSKFSEYAQGERFITASQLKAKMDSKADVVVIGALNPLRPDSPITDSFRMWRNDYSAQNGHYEFGGMSNTAKEMANILGSYGATEDSTIVVYAANSHHDAARLYWQIKELGHQDVRYLDGGLNAWIGNGYPTGGVNPQVAQTQYTLSDAADSISQLATLEMVIEAQHSDDWVIIDTRTDDEFEGATTANGAFGPGTIPTSVHIEWNQALNEDTTLKSAEELANLYGDLIKGKKVIAYCQSGVRSAHTTMVLTEVLGAEEVYNYDGSWIEYSHAYYEDDQKNVNVINGNG